MSARRRARGAFRVAGALFAFWWLIGGTLWAAPGASPHPGDGPVHVHWVLDGDTVELDSGRRVRLIGLDTPEVAHRDRPAEPYADEATKALRRLLSRSDGQVVQRQGRERQDRYGRQLAHLFLPDGTSITAALLRQGLGVILVVPPNTWNLPCYLDAERAARQARRGIWALPGYQPVAATELGRGARGYRLVAGRVARVGRGGGAQWIDLEGGLAVRITEGDLRYFPGIDFGTWVGRRVLARGMVYQRRGQLRMRIRHPALLELLPEAG